uniref:Uncharacterized protein n=1 Tax=Pristhesancus plagipennis TaxID=1955184 RepID=A0A2K8JS91_PRIPG|nr:secreted hypothetical protein [Pristhesancus plagipennis]
MSFLTIFFSVILLWSCVCVCVVTCYGHLNPRGILYCNECIVMKRDHQVRNVLLLM